MISKEKLEQAVKALNDYNSLREQLTFHVAEFVEKDIDQNKGSTSSKKRYEVRSANRFLISSYDKEQMESLANRLNEELECFFNGEEVFLIEQIKVLEELNND